MNLHKELTRHDNREQQFAELVNLICESADRRGMQPHQRDHNAEREIREVTAEAAARLHLTLYEERDWLWGQVRARCELLALGLMDDDLPDSMPDPADDRSSTTTRRPGWHVTTGGTVANR